MTDSESAAANSHDVPPAPIVGLLIPEFPAQTHCAWWRVGNAFRSLGVEMQMLSTKRPPHDPSAECHDFLVEESKQTHYCWPPRALSVIGLWARRPSAMWAGLRYIATMHESTMLEKLKALPLALSAADLCAYAKKRKLDAIFVHSCANAAHVVAMCRAMGGPPYALRLGGHLSVYGKDYQSKMQDAAFIASSAPAFIPEIVDRAQIPEQRIMWTWVGTDLQKFTPRSESLGRDDGSLHAVTVARLNRTKGHAYVLQALASLRDQGINVRYTIVGTGPEDERLRTQVSDLNLGDRVSLVGSKSMDDVIDLLRTADVVILASYGVGEAAPAVVTEAMACGVPVICTRIGATEQMFTDGQEGFLVPQRDPQSIATALERLHTNEPLRQQMAQAALKHAPIFDCREVARKLLHRFRLVDAD